MCDQTIGTSGFAALFGDPVEKGCESGAHVSASMKDSNTWCDVPNCSHSSLCLSEHESSMGCDDMKVDDLLFDDDKLVSTLGRGPFSCVVDRTPIGFSETMLIEQSRYDSETSDTSYESALDDFDLEPVPIRHGVSTGSRPSKQSATLLQARLPAYAPADTISLIPDELLCEILSFLDVTSLLASREASKRLRLQGSKDEAGWTLHLATLWQGKVTIPAAARKAKQGSEAMKAYHLSFQDGNSRKEIREQELCFDPETGGGTIWYFRFKESAGAAWTSFDPWHAGLPSRKMIFLKDGTVQELVPDPTYPNALIVVRPFLDAPHYHAEMLGNEDGEDGVQISMKWRFIDSPMDMPSRPRGAYIRLNVAGRDVPAYISQRSPTGNWGFILENCWGLFASFPLPEKMESGRSLPARPTRMRLRRTSGGGVRWLNVDGIENEDGDDQDDMDLDEQRLTSDGGLLRDSALQITSRQQWREALLYNYGSVTLPEGEAARAEFDRIFASFRSPISSLDNVMR